MPCKNNLIIYDEVYRAAVIEFGLWNQVRVDHGKEFYLTFYVHEKVLDMVMEPFPHMSKQCQHVTML